VINANDAREVAQLLLEDELPQRWAHTRGVAERARGLARVLGEEAELIETAAWLHDIGYASRVTSTGLHSLDGARYLRDTLKLSDDVCQLVAHHTCAAIEADERGFSSITKEFAAPPPHLLEALTFCDMTSSVDGAPTSVEKRLAEILTRYPEDHVVHRSITRSMPVLKAAVRSVDQRLREAG
jgi:putative nucleotidyltransferase with HDIG domain